MSRIHEELQLNTKKTNEQIKTRAKDVNTHFSKKIYKWSMNTGFVVISALTLTEGFLMQRWKGAPLPLTTTDPLLMS